MKKAIKRINQNLNGWKKSNTAIYIACTLYKTIVIITLCVVIFSIVGFAVDRYFRINNAYLFLGGILGIAVGWIITARISSKFYEKINEFDQEEKD